MSKNTRIIVWIVAVFVVVFVLPTVVWLAGSLFASPSGSVQPV